MFANIESKVIAAAAGAGGGGAVSGFALWLLGITVWGAPADASHATDAAAAVPGPVSALVAVVLVILGAAIAGYAAPHTPRPDLTAKQSTPAPAVPVTTVDAAMGAGTIPTPEPENFVG